MTTTVADPRFASGAGLSLRLPRHRVSPRARVWWAARVALLGLPLPAVFLVLALTIPPAATVFGWLTLGFAAPVLVWLVVEPVWRFRVHRWEVTETAVYVVSGWLWQRWRLVPLSRVQSVDSLRGPLQQSFGLAGVTVATAAATGAVRITGLDRRCASELIEYLGATIQATAGVSE